LNDITPFWRRQRERRDVDLSFDSTSRVSEIHVKIPKRTKVVKTRFLT